MREYLNEKSKIENSIQSIEKQEQKMLEASGDNKIKKSLTEEYYKIKAKIYEETVQMQQELSSQLRALDRVNMSVMLTANKKEDLERKLNQIEHKLKVNDESLKAEVKYLEEVKNEFQEVKMQLAQNENQLSAFNDEVNAKEKEALLLKGEIAALEEEKEIRREEKKIKEALEELKKYQKGYYGFFYELIHPIQNKYEIAIKVALQNILKMIVVDSIDVAQKVDEFLSEKGLYLDCLILEKIPQDSSSKIHSNRKKLEGKGHMIVDVVDCDKEIKGLENALKFFCKDKVVSLEDKDGYDNIIFLKNKGFKRIISLDGTSLNNGMFEGGHQSNIFDKNLGSIKQDKVIKDLKSKLDSVMQKITIAKNDKRDLETKIKQQKADMITKETEIRLKEEHISNLRNVNSDSIKSINEEIKVLEEDLSTFVSKRKDLNSSVKDITKEIAGIEKEEFKDFFKKAKIDNIQQFEGTNIKEFEENARQMQTLNEKLNQIKTMIDQLGVEQISKSIQLLKSEEEEAKKSMTEIEQDLKELEEQFSTKADKKSEVDKDFVEFRKKQDKEERTIKKDEEELLMYKKRIQELEKCLQEEKYSIKSKYIAILKMMVMMEQITDKQAESSIEKVDLSLEVKEIFKKIKKFDIDYESLEIDVEKVTENDMRKQIAQLEKQLKDKEKAIEDFERVSMLAPECKKEIKTLSDKMNELKENYEKGGEEGKSTTDKLREIKKLRSEAINNLIQILNEKLSPIYQNLTKKDEYIFGTAHLMIEDKINPFNGSINFIPNPPGKRSIYDIQQLSSGEKSMAVLSFVFTLVKYCDFPFLILDETDSHLDDPHIQKIVYYITKYLNKQCIFVSHKEKTIESSDSLVGVTFDIEKNTSQCFSLDLRN